MLMIPALFDGETREKAKAHYERFNQYIKFQTKQGNIQDTTKEVIELFEHTQYKKALIWFQQHKAVLSLYSYIAQSQDQDSDNIPKPFESEKGKGGKKSGKGKQNSQQQPQSPPPYPVEEVHYEETYNYYHNEN